MKKLGKLLRELRGKESLRDASERIGISHTYLDTIEKGQDKRSGSPVKPTPDTLKLISNAYDYDYKELMKLAGYFDEKLERIFLYRPGQNPSDDWVLYPINDMELILEKGTTVLTNATADVDVPFDMSIESLIDYITEQHDLKDSDKKGIKISGTYQLLNKDEIPYEEIDREEKDIAKRMEQIKKEITNSDGLMFNGEPMSEEAIESLLEAMEHAVRQTQRINKKYIPKKYRDNNE